MLMIINNKIYAQLYTAYKHVLWNSTESVVNKSAKIIPQWME